MEECDLKLSSVQSEIDAIQSQLKRLKTEKEVLSKKAISDNEYIQNIKQAEKNVERLSNRLHSQRLREGSMRRWNKQLRDMAKHVIHERMLFNYLYTKIVVRLSRRKKILIDLVDEAVLALDDGTDLCKRITNLKNKSRKDFNDNVNEMLVLMLNMNVNERKFNFYENKERQIQIRELSPREQKRRVTFKCDHSKDTERYKQLLNDTQQITEQRNNSRVVEKFKGYEQEYFSYYTYLNELNLHIENMIGASAFLPKTEPVVAVKMDETVGVNRLKYWQERLSNDSEIGARIQEELDNAQTALKNNFNQIKQLFTMLKCDGIPQNAEIANIDVSVQNYELFLTTIEMQLKEILGQVYCAERRENQDVTEGVIVRDVEVTPPQPFDYGVLNNLVHDCAECEASQNLPNNKNIIPPLDISDLGGLVEKKINSPEMQYRMHNIEKCNIPRSRILYTKYLQNN